MGVFAVTKVSVRPSPGSTHRGLVESLHVYRDAVHSNSFGY
jgi:hypothetical protein